MFLRIFLNCYQVLLGVNEGKEKGKKRPFFDNEKTFLLCSIFNNFTAIFKLVITCLVFLLFADQSLPIQKVFKPL